MILKELKKHFYSKGCPKIGSEKGDSYTDLYNDMLIQINQGYSEDEIYEYIKKNGCKRAKDILSKLEKK